MPPVSRKKSFSRVIDKLVSSLGRKMLSSDYNNGNTFYSSSYNQGSVGVFCNGDEYSLDECIVQPSYSCSSRYGQGTVRISCKNNTSIPPCKRVVQTANGTVASQANCNNLGWFVCKSKPEIIHDI